MSEFHLVLVNFVVAGLEIAASVAFTFIPPLLLKSGYSETQMTIIFGVGEKTFINLQDAWLRVAEAILQGDWGRFIVWEIVKYGLFTSWGCC